MMSDIIVALGKARTRKRIDQLGRQLTDDDVKEIVKCITLVMQKRFPVPPKTVKLIISNKRQLRHFINPSYSFKSKRRYLNQRGGAGWSLLANIGKLIKRVITKLSPSLVKETGRKLLPSRFMTKVVKDAGKTNRLAATVAKGGSQAGTVGKAALTAAEAIKPVAVGAKKIPAAVMKYRPRPKTSGEKLMEFSKLGTKFEGIMSGGVNSVMQIGEIPIVKEHVTKPLSNWWNSL